MVVRRASEDACGALPPSFDPRSAGAAVALRAAWEGQLTAVTRRSMRRFLGQVEDDTASGGWTGAGLSLAPILLAWQLLVWSGWRPDQKARW